MSAQPAPIIIKRKKVIAGGHHGGAWKVAYADFVTAMMAFFMLMWLLNATTEQQRNGIADYFSPSLPISRVSGGGDGMFGGDDIYSQDTLAQSGDGPNELAEELDGGEAGEDAEGVAVAAEIEALREIEQILMGEGGEALISETALRHVVTRLTDEGLVIEIFALPDVPIFDGDTAEPLPSTRMLIEMVARVSSVVTNPVAISAHVSSRPVVRSGSPGWDITGARADMVRRILEDAGLRPERVMRVTGHSDRSPHTVGFLSP